MPRLEVSIRDRFVRLWVSLNHSYILTFHNPKCDTWWYVLLGEDWWGEADESGRCGMERYRDIWYLAPREKA